LNRKKRMSAWMHSCCVRRRNILTIPTKDKLSSCTITMKLSTTTATVADVAVLGAGMSGLRAAQVLRQQGCQHVTVLEARDMAGGRIRWTHMPVSSPWSSSSSSSSASSSSSSSSSSSQDSNGNESSSVYLDEGAQFIHGVNKNNPTVKLAAEHKIPYRKVHWDDGYLFIGPNQQELPAKQNRKHDAAHEDIWRKLYRWKKERKRSKNPKDEPLENVLAPLITEQAGEDLEKQQRLWMTFRMSISDDYGEDLSKLSALYFDQDEESPGGDAVPHTYQKLIETMLLPTENMEKDDGVLYQHVVKQIIFPYPDGPVRIRCRRADTDEDVEIQAKRVISTLPLGVLKQQHHNLFHPALPQRLQDSIQRLGYGCLEKIWLSFSCEPFWPTDADVFYHYASETPFRVWFLPTRVYRNLAYRRTLCCFVSGAAARSMAHESNAVICDKVMAALREILPVPDPIDTSAQSSSLVEHIHVTRWSVDPWSGDGSYSYCAVGSTAGDYRAFESSSYDDRLWFAGEATTAQYPGTVHGAYLTGERAAKACWKTL